MQIAKVEYEIDNGIGDSTYGCVYEYETLCRFETTQKAKISWDAIKQLSKHLNVSFVFHGLFVREMNGTDWQKVDWQPE